MTDKGKIIGCTTDNTIRSKIQDIANNCDPRIPIHIETVRYEGVKLLVISVEESFDKPVRCSKGFFLREGPNSQKLTRNEILALAAGAGKFKFDMQPCRSFNYPEDFKDKKWRHFLDKSKFGKLSVARNPIIFDAFYRLGITEKIGSGIARMREAMAERGIKIAFDTEDFFIVTLTRPETTRKVPTPQVTPQDTPQVTPQALSDVELRILGFCHEERSASEIINFTGMNPDYIRKELIPKLIERVFLALTIPDKPRSPHQKYILTEAGMKHVKGR